MSGNERTDGGFALLNSNIKSGYPITERDSFILTTELMNMEDKEKWAWVTVTYELLDGALRTYLKGKNVFQTIGGISCGGIMSQNPFGPSNVTAYQQPKSLVFEERSIPCKSPGDGIILSTGGHMHDGGTSTEIYLCGQRICESIPHYGKSQPTSSHGGRRKKRQLNVGSSDEDNAHIEHISKQDMCDFPDGIAIQKGDEMFLKVNCDFNKHPG
ncbi:hypothetical protein EJ08DRAFT_42134 [Tothia fuscella]|uniref:Uncharacterized protein n=1 Tax=Tothia fuscella TaxID=1048955 RepID=A0A9P4U1U4_9PEZI|nr:hypothetical protein EJ08DRAFT_42134 [Tothia fuscella]